MYLAGKPTRALGLGLLQHFPFSVYSLSAFGLALQFP